MPKAPIHQPEDVHLGFSDRQLEALATWKVLEKGISPWATWEAENSSFGRTFRKWLYYPSFLPLFFCSDHAVHWESKCWPNEVNNKFNLFLTWNVRKHEKMRTYPNKQSLHVPHPWIHYRRSAFKHIAKERRGTLVFYPHSNGTSTPNIESVEEYIGTLKNLPQEFHPIVVCLSFHDINKGLHKSLRRFNLPLVTAGSTSSQYFVDRFYSLIRQFSSSTSCNIGSHLFYAVEAEVPFFLLGEAPSYSLHNSDALEDGKAELSDYGDEVDLMKRKQIEEQFSKPTQVINENQKQIVFDYLGLHSSHSRLSVSFKVWLALFKNLHNAIFLYALFCKKLFNKLKSLYLVRKS